MVKDLNFHVNIISMPIVHEPDGLAMSSRNKYLTPEERKAALVLSRALFAAKDMVNEGQRDKDIIIKNVRDVIMNQPLVQIEYVEMVNADTLDDIDGKIEGKVMLALAARIGKTRLIDNIVLEV
jgi:pantoate--beta-alanine ligase